MSDVDFSQVNGVRIPDGDVKYIENETRTACLWQRPFTYPICAGVFLSYIPTAQGETVRVEVTPKIYLDRYQTSKVLMDEDSSYIDTLTQNQLVIRKRYLDLLELPSESVSTSYLDDYRSPFSWVRNNSSVFCACLIRNEDELNNIGAHSAGVNYAQIIWSNELKMYASPSGLAMGTWAFCKLGTSGFACKEQVYELVTHETDVTITDFSPLITLRQLNSNHWAVQSKTTNFDEYRNKYEAATNGRFSKSTYPYLVGNTQLTIVGAYGNAYNGRCHIPISFTVRR